MLRELLARRSAKWPVRPCQTQMASCPALSSFLVAPIFFGFPRYRRRIRVLALDPMPRAAGAIRQLELSLRAVHPLLHAVMHLQIVEAGEQLTLRYVANGPHCQAMWIGLTESRSAGGTEQTAGMLSGHLFGPGGNTTPEDIGSMGGEYGPLRRRHSGKGRAVPGRCPSIPSRCSFRCARPIYAAGFSAVVPAHAGRLLERRDQVASIRARAIASMTSVSRLQRHEPTPR
jgi:hypothetical protein